MAVAAFVRDEPLAAWVSRAVIISGTGGVAHIRSISDSAVVNSPVHPAAEGEVQVRYVLPSYESWKLRDSRTTL